MGAADDFPISAKGLNHWFGTGEARKQAVFDVDLDVARGSLTVLVGPSGSGKTTVLTLLGHELHGADAALLTRLRRRLGFIFQAHNLHESLTARQNVIMGLEVHGKVPPDRAEAAASHVPELVGLGDRLDYLPANLSGGQKQRVAVARALVGNPDIIFADEPTAALDRESGANVVAMIKRLGHARGTTTVMVTHDNRILDQADRIITLEDGRIVDDVVVTPV